MSMNKSNSWRSPCEVLREINDLFQGDDELDQKVRMLLAECEYMTKHMSIELSKYKPNYHKRWPRKKGWDKDDARRKQSDYKYHKL